MGCPTESLHQHRDGPAECALFFIIQLQGWNDEEGCTGIEADTARTGVTHTPRWEDRQVDIVGKTEVGTPSCAMLKFE